MANSRIKLISKILCLGMVLVMGFILLAACNSIYKHHATLYDNVGEFINKQFMDDNLSFRPNGKTAESKFFIIKSQSEFDEIFNGFYKNIDFDKQIVLLKVLGSCTSAHKFKLSKLSIENKKLTAEYYYADCKGNEECASSPHIRYMALIIDRIDISEFDFIHTS